jgi:hypothetical protein
LNLQETLALIETLKANGVTRFKSQEHEIDLVWGPAQPKKVDIPQTSHDPKVVAEANEKLKTMINTINMSPEELANKMFPDGAL